MIVRMIIIANTTTATVSTTLKLLVLSDDAVSVGKITCVVATVASAAVVSAEVSDVMDALIVVVGEPGAVASNLKFIAIIIYNIHLAS